MQQLQYPDGSQIGYAYNQAGQIAGVADAVGVVNGSILRTALEIKPSNDRLAWFDKALGVNNAYATSTSAPLITTQPGSTTVIAPATAVWTITATGTPVPTYQWMQKSSGATVFTAIAGATKATYTTPATTTANNGMQYQCVVTNTAGNVTSSTVILTVNPPVSALNISNQPVNKTVTVPATATFFVTVTGNTTPSYQWMQKALSASTFTPITGATNASYITPATTLSNNGTQYECVVTSSAGSITSVPAMLTILGVPMVSLASNNNAYAAPATVTLTATASETNGTMSRVDFYNGTTLLGSSNTAPYTYLWNNVSAGSYSFTAKAYDANGVTATSSAIIVNVIATNIYIKNITYNANGQITQIQYGNGAVTAYTYNALNFRLKRIYTTNAQSLIIQDLNYTYDPLGQVLSIKDNVNTATQTFVYDALNRLTGAQNVNYGSKIYAYDNIGNIVQKDGINYTYAEANSRTNGTAAGPHAVTSLSNGTTFKGSLKF